MPKNKQKICLGDYVLASHFKDADPYDPWRIGFVCRIITTWKGESTGYIIGEQDGTWEDNRQYNHARKIAKNKGKKWIEQWQNKT